MCAPNASLGKRAWRTPTPHFVPAGLKGSAGTFVYTVPFSRTRTTTRRIEQFTESTLSVSRIETMNLPGTLTLTRNLTLLSAFRLRSGLRLRNHAPGRCRSFPNGSWKALFRFLASIRTVNRLLSRAVRKAPINRTHSRRFARFGDTRQSRSVWSVRLQRRFSRANCDLIAADHGSPRSLFHMDWNDELNEGSAELLFGTMAARYNQKKTCPTAIFRHYPRTQIRPVVF
jgi:hypothetical protein